MTNPAAVDRTIRQLDNDVQAIYEMLAKIEATQARHGNRLDEMSADVAEVKDKLDGVTGRLDGVDAKLDAILAHLRGSGDRS